MTYRGAAQRYRRRLQVWKRRRPELAEVRHHGWWLVHNCIAHPILGLRASEAAIWFHDWSSKHLNCRESIRRSPTPQIASRREWAWHNIAGHLAIGLMPCEPTFAFHDRTSEAMNVPDWL